MGRRVLLGGHRAWTDLPPTAGIVTLWSRVSDERPYEFRHEPVLGGSRRFGSRTSQAHSGRESQASPPPLVLGESESARPGDTFSGRGRDDSGIGSNRPPCTSWGVA